MSTKGCDKIIPGTLSPGHWAAEYGGVACLRKAGHRGPCIEVMADAKRADAAPQPVVRIVSRSK